MEKPVVESEVLVFCYTKPEDLEKIMEIEKENNRFVYTWSRERHMQAIESEEELHIAIRRKSDNGIVGYALLNEMNSGDNCIEFRRIAIGEQGKGYGRESIRLMKKMCFEVFKCHRLWLDVYEDNIIAQKLYRSEGFVQEGIMRDCKKHGDTYRSMLLMSMLEQEYRDQCTP